MAGRRYGQLLAGFAVVALLSGCSDSSERPATDPSATTKGANSPSLWSSDLPTLDGETNVDVGTTYAYFLYTHCGVDWVLLDGDMWQAKESRGGGNSPAGWGTPEHGTVTFVTNERASYADEKGHSVTFIRQADHKMMWCA